MSLGLGILLGAAVACLLAPRRSGISPWAAALGCTGASAFGLADAFQVLTSGTPLAISWPLALPGGAIALGLDALSAFFLVLILVLAPLAAVFGAAYLRRHRGESGLRAASGVFCLLVAAMVLVITSRNGLLFLMGWEAMTITSWFLVVSDHHQESVRIAGRRYLIASQLGGACLLVVFAVLGRLAGSLDFSSLSGAAPQIGSLEIGLLYTLALVGFGTKAGLLPVHVWLPLAHPAAPSHVSALMSGVMIKMGFYGLLRLQALVGPPPLAVGVTLILIGAVTAIYGIASALGQRDLKRALACSSIENMGIVALGLGLTATAARLDRPAIAAMAAAGTLLHLLNHMVMKGLLFLGAGAVYSATHTRDIEELGGLQRRMPWTGATFLAGAVAISALPPFAGIVGEWLLLAACYGAAMSFPVEAAVVVILAGLSLVVAGGLAAASFARLFGTVFLGEPRSAAAAGATEASSFMIAPLVLLAAASLGLGLWPQAPARLLMPLIESVAGVPDSATAVLGILAPLQAISGTAGVLFAALLLALLVRGCLKGLRTPSGPGTWGCGYSRPTSKLQYTGSSFGNPLVGVFASVLRPQIHEVEPKGLFPDRVSSRTLVPDRFERGIYEPLFAAIARRLAAVRRFQHGQLSKYLLQIAAALVAGLLWAIASRWLIDP